MMPPTRRPLAWRTLLTGPLWLLLLLPAVAAGTPPEAPDLVVQRWYQAPEEPTLAALRGRPVLLNFWGLWCAPCVQALPEMKRIVETFGDRGLVVLGIHTPADSEQLEDFLRQNEVAFPVGVDTEKTAQRYQLRNYPTYVLIDRQGRIRQTTVRVPDDASIQELLQEDP